MAVNVSISPEQLAAFCRKHHIQKLSPFGSTLRDDFSPDSDVDVLVEFEPGHTPGLAFFTMEDELSALFGRKVDLPTPRFLSPYFRKAVQFGGARSICKRMMLVRKSSSSPLS